MRENADQNNSEYEHFAQCESTPLKLNCFYFNPLVSNAPLRFSDVFRRKKKGVLGTNGLMINYKSVFAFTVPFTLSEL